MDDPLTDKRVVILGLARQGLALTRWLVEHAGAHVTVSDLHTADQLADVMAELEDVPIRYVLGGHPDSLLDDADLVCLSGGVPVDAPIVLEAAARGIPLSNDAQIFMERCPCDAIGITGSAGKTTTTALVGAIGDAAGRITWVGGNIGNPLIADLSYIRSTDQAVIELSSFQLELMTVSPQVAAVLNITPNHLDRHKTMEAYTNAKARIVENQIVGDWAVLGLDDPGAAALASRTGAQIAHFSGRQEVDIGAWLDGDHLMIRSRMDRPAEPIGTTDMIQLRGYHNVLNVLAACAVTGVAGMPVAAMRAAIASFTGEPHRLEVVREWHGVTYINDSIATAPERVVAALKSFDEPLVLLLGGRDKKLPWESMLTLAAQKARTIITFGEAGPMIARQAQVALMEAAQAAQGGMAPNVRIEQVDTLPEAVELAAHMARPGDVVLLSPGGTSYDAYHDFEARGEHFRQLVNDL
jgi:UDP-N-acetylmuramoylalanine--D-glutamate ligase